MKTSQAKNRLETILRESGFRFDNPYISIAWSAFKAFVQEPVDCADDDILFECGLSGISGKKSYIVAFVRQFSFESDGEYSHMEHLRCSFYCELSDELATLQTNLWAEEFDSLEDYFLAVENLPEFQALILQSLNWTCEISQEGV